MARLLCADRRRPVELPGTVACLAPTSNNSITSTVPLGVCSSRHGLSGWQITGLQAGGFMSEIAYSASSVDLFFPCRRGQFFPSGLPESEAAICAEMCRLAYCRTSISDFALDQIKLQSVLAATGFSAPQCFETTGLPENRGTHCFLTVHPGRKLAVLAVRGTDKDDPTNLTDDVEFRLEKWEAGGRVHSGFATTLSQGAGLSCPRPARRDSPLASPNLLPTSAGAGCQRSYTRSEGQHYTYGRIH